MNEDGLIIGLMGVSSSDGGWACAGVVCRCCIAVVVLRAVWMRLSMAERRAKRLDLLG